MELMSKPTDTQEDELRDTSFRWLKTVQGFTPEATLLSLQELLSTQREQARQELLDELDTEIDRIEEHTDRDEMHSDVGELREFIDVKRTSLKEGGKKE